MPATRSSACATRSRRGQRPAGSRAPDDAKTRPGVRPASVIGHNGAVLLPVGDPPLSRLHRPVLTAAVALAALTATGCAGGAIGADTPVSSGKNFVGSSYESTVFRAGRRPQAPAVSGTTVTGSKLSLAAYRGDVVVLNFWGSWCAPCRDEAPALGTLASELQPRGV